MGNIEEHTSFVGANRVRYKQAYISLAVSQRFTHVLTLAYHRASVPMPVVRESMRDLHGRVDEALFGRRFYQLPNHARTFALFAVEGVPHAVHVHSLWRVPKGREGANLLMRFHRLFPGEQGGVWQDLVAGGTHKLRIISDHADAVNYVLKEQHMDSEENTILLSSEFAPAR